MLDPEQIAIVFYVIAALYIVIYILNLVFNNGYSITVATFILNDYN